MFRRNQIVALKDFSLDVHPAQIFALLGPNGAGKTTLLKILLSIIHPSAGSATLLGESITTTAVRKKIGYLPENHRYPPYLTGEQVLRHFGLLSGVDSHLLSQRIDLLLARVGMNEWRRVKTRKYSKGMLQRLGLAQALMNDPDLVFLDEPTDGVDPVGRKDIRTILQELRHEGKTVFLNSHLLSEVELISDRVAVLDRGRLVTVSTVEALTTSQSTVRIGVAGVIPEALKSASVENTGLRYSQDAVEAEVASIADLNRVIDLLRAHKVEITSVTQPRTTLEESVLRLLTPEKKS